MQNVCCCVEWDVESVYKFVFEKFVGDIFIVVDSLEWGLVMLDLEDEVFKLVCEGLEFILKVLFDVFVKYNLEQIDLQGELFNLEYYEVMIMILVFDVEFNFVVEVLEKGY